MIWHLNADKTSPTARKAADSFYTPTDFHMNRQIWLPKKMWRSNLNIQDFCEFVLLFAHNVFQDSDSKSKGMITSLHFSHLLLSDLLKLGVDFTQIDLESRPLSRSLVKNTSGIRQFCLIQRLNPGHLREDKI